MNCHRQLNNCWITNNLKDRRATENGSMSNETGKLERRVEELKETFERTSSRVWYVRIWSTQMNFLSTIQYRLEIFFDYKFAFWRGPSFNFTGWRFSRIEWDKEKMMMKLTVSRDAKSGWWEYTEMSATSRGSKPVRTSLTCRTILTWGHSRTPPLKQV